MGGPSYMTQLFRGISGHDLVVALGLFLELLCPNLCASTVSSYRCLSDIPGKVSKCFLLEDYDWESNGGSKPVGRSDIIQIYCAMVTGYQGWQLPAITWQ